MVDGEWGRWRGSGVDDRGRSTGGVGLRASTPHLTSPLRGGRDELGRRCGCGGGTIRLAGALTTACGWPSDDGGVEVLWGRAWFLPAQE